MESRGVWFGLSAALVAVMALTIWHIYTDLQSINDLISLAELLNAHLYIFPFQFCGLTISLFYVILSI